MTVASLWEALREAGCVTRLDGPAAFAWLDGKVLALDFSIDLVAQMSVHAGGGAQEAINSPAMARKLVFERTVWLLRLGAHVIGCGDGAPPAAKAATLRTRFASRHHGARGGGGPNRAFLQLVHEAARVLQSIHCPTLVSGEVGEGEARAAALCAAGYADAVASSDADALLHGAPILVHRIDVAGGDERKASLEYVALADVRERLGIGERGMLGAALLLGCDFGAGVGGAGARKAPLAVRELVRRSGGDESAALDRVCALADGPECAAEAADEARALSLSACRGLCRVCGHPCGQARHGPRGCSECGCARALAVQLTTATLSATGIRKRESE